MSDELEKLLDDGQNKDHQRKEGDDDKKVEKTPEQIKEEEKRKEEEHLANIRKAIAEGNEELKKIRNAKKKAKSGEDDEEEEIPEIDFKDKSAKAWDKHIKGEVDPLKDELSKEKEEVRTFALKHFLKDKPTLAKDSEKVKQMLSTYDKIKTASERTVEGVLLDLRKAYAAEFADEILQDKENERFERAEGEYRFSDVAISRGGSDSSHREEKEKAPHLSSSDEAILAKWGVSPEEWVKMKKAQDKKEKK